MKTNDRQSSKFKIGEIMIIGSVWLIAIALIYVVYLKIIIFAH